jgi:hypothetical protein
MSKDEVITTLGTPDSTSAQSNVEYLTYYLQADSGNGRDQPYMVRLVDGKVESFGRFLQLFDLMNRPVTNARAGDPNFPTANGFNTGGVQVVTVPRHQNDDLVSQIQRLKLLHDQGTLTDEEFKKAKDKLLNDESK